MVVPLLDFVITGIRHDIDLAPKCALAVAEIEHSHGILGFYFFRVKP